MATTRVGDTRRRQVLDRAVHLASRQGLEGLTLGRLAAELDISKSGLQVLFGSKQALQLAIVATAAEVFERQVLQRAESADDGLARVRALFDAWIDYLEVFEGGCFFIAAASELDDRPGPVREAVLEAATRGMGLVRHHLRLARRLGELDPDTDVDQLLFELHGIVLEANLMRRMFRHPEARDRARIGVARHLDAARPS